MSGSQAAGQATEGMAGWWPALLAAALCVVLGIVFWGPGMFTGVSTFASHDGWVNDWFQYQVPVRAVCAEAIREGRLPWWTDRLGAGVPLLAEGQVGCLYPANVALLSVMSTVPALHVLLLLHQAVAAAGAARLFGAFGVRRGTAVAAGLAFAFCAYFVARARQLNLVEAAAWAPWCWFYGESLVRNRGAGWTGARTRTIAALAIVATMAILAGHPQIAYYHGLVVGLWVVVRLSRLRAAPNEWSRTLLSCGAAGATAACLGAPQWVLTLEFSRLTVRQGGLGAAAMVQDLPPSTAGTWLWPYLFGDPSLGTGAERAGAYHAPGGTGIAWWEMVAWVGTLPWLVLLLLGLSSLLRRVRPGVGGHAPELVAVFCSTLVASWGQHAGVGQALVDWLPGYGLFRAPARLSVFSSLALLALGARVIDRWVAVDGPRAALRYLFWIWLVAEPVLVLRGAQGKRDAAAMVTTPELLVAARSATGDARPERLRLYSFDPDPAAWTEADRAAGGWSGDLAPYDRVLASAPVNSQAIWGWSSIDLYMPAGPRAQLALSAAAVIEVAGRPQVNLRLLRTWGVPWVVVDERAGIDRPPVRVRWRPPGRPAEPGIELRQLERVEPFVRLVPDAILVDAAAVTAGGARGAASPPRLPEPFFAAFMDPAHDPGRRAIVTPAGWSGDIGFPTTPSAPLVPAGTPLSDAISAATMLVEGPKGTGVQVDLDRPAWLVIARLALPGWTVAIDGAARPLWTADGGALAVDVPAGKHEVTFAYDPPGRTLGFSLGAVGLLLLSALLGSRRGAAT